MCLIFATPLELMTSPSVSSELRPTLRTVIPSVITELVLRGIKSEFADAVRYVAGALNTSNRGIDEVGPARCLEVERDPIVEHRNVVARAIEVVGPRLYDLIAHSRQPVQRQDMRIAQYEQSRNSSVLLPYEQPEGPSSSISQCPMLQPGIAGMTWSA